MFLNTLESYQLDQLDKLSGVIANPRDRSIRLIPYVPVEMIHFDPNADDDGAMGVNFSRIDDRFEKLRNFIHTEFQHIAQHMTDGAAKFNADDSKAKTEDLFIHFNTKEPGDKVEFFMTLSRVPAIFDPTKPIDPSMVPMTDEERLELFAYPTRQKEKAAAGITLGEEIEAAMDRVNKRIQDFIHNIDTENYPSCMDYTIKIVNGVLIPMIVTLQLEPYGWFGGTAKNLTNPAIPNTNSDECCAIIDQAITELFAHLDSIPVPDGSGIDHYAIDHDSFGIYGRDANQRVVQAMVDPNYMFSTVLEPKYSTGFTEAFKRYLKTVKNKHVFTQIGKIDEESVKSAAAAALNETIPDALECINEGIAEVAKENPSTAPAFIKAQSEGSDAESWGDSNVNHDNQVEGC